MNQKSIDLKEFGSFDYIYNENNLIINKLFTLNSSLNLNLPSRLLNPFSIISSIGMIEYHDFLVLYCNENEEGLKIKYIIKEVIEYTIDFKIEKSLGIITRNDEVKNLSNISITFNQLLNKYYFNDDEYEIYYQDSAWCYENIGSWHKPNSLLIENEGGRTTQGHTPFIVIRNKNQQAISFHLKPIGNYHISLQKVSLGVGNPRQYINELKLGIRSENLSFKLNPNETLVLPEVYIQSIPNGRLNESTVNFHKYLLKCNRKYITHKVVYNTWFDKFDHIDYDELVTNLEKAKELSCETFVVDAGWFGDDNFSWWDSIGDWRERQTSAFKGKMKEFSEIVRSKGLDFGLWIEPERISKNAPIYKSKPEYFLIGNGFYYPDLNNIEVFNYIYNEITSLIEKYELKWIKWDFNFELCEDPLGTNFFIYYQALYRLLDKLKINYPNVFIEGCASGGLRNDLNTVSHYDGYFLCDNVNPKATLLMYHHAILRLDPYKIIKWLVVKTIDNKLITTSGNGAGFDNYEEVDLNFALTVSMLGMIGLSGNYLDLTIEQDNLIKHNIEIYKKHRNLLANCYVYTDVEPKQSLDDYTFLNFQYKHINKDEMIIMSFKLNTNSNVSIFYLKEVNLNLNYILNDDIIIKGNYLANNGLTICFNHNETAKLITLKSIL